MFGVSDLKKFLILCFNSTPFYKIRNLIQENKRNMPKLNQTFIIVDVTFNFSKEAKLFLLYHFVWCTLHTILQIYEKLYSRYFKKNILK